MAHVSHMCKDGRPSLGHSLSGILGRAVRGTHFFEISSEAWIRRAVGGPALENLSERRGW